NQKISGVDAEFNVSGIDVGGGTMGWRLLAARLNENSILTPGSPRDDRAGDIGFGAPKNKVTTSLTYARGPWSLFLQGRYIDGGTMNRNFTEGVQVDDNTVGSVFYTDLTFRFSGRSGGAPWQVFFTANNLFNEEPPATYPNLGRAGVPGPNSILYDTIARRYTAGVRGSERRGALGRRRGGRRGFGGGRAGPRRPLAGRELRTGFEFARLFLLPLTGQRAVNAPRGLAAAGAARTVRCVRATLLAGAQHR